MNAKIKMESGFVNSTSELHCSHEVYAKQCPTMLTMAYSTNLQATTRMLRKALLVLACSLGTVCGYAAEYFVAPDGGHQTPFQSWGTAATNVQDALNLANTANNGSTVWISNGNYKVIATLEIKNVTVRGFGGDRSAVVIDGNGSVRPFLLNNASAMLQNVTVTNGYAANILETTWLGNGGGIYVNLGAVSNCLITSCICTNQGGGVYMKVGTSVAACDIVDNKDSAGILHGAGGVYLQGGKLTDSLIARNNGLKGGAYAAGGVAVAGWQSCVVENCVISNNLSTARVGGVFLGPSTQLKRSTIIDNFGAVYGGVFVNSAAGSEVVACRIIGNMASNTVDGAVGGLCLRGGEKYATVRNCLISHNVVFNPTTIRGTGGLASSGDCTVESCTIVSNTLFRSGLGTGGYYDGGGATNHLINCIVYGNKSAFAASYDNLYLGILANTNRFLNNCTTSLLYKNLPQGNITVSPGLVDYENGDAHLLVDSPCLDIGTNLVWMIGAVDLDGNPRLDKRYLKVDIGCYEQIPPPFGTVIVLK